VPGAPHAGACGTKHCILTTNYQPKSRSRRSGDQLDEKQVIVRGAFGTIIDKLEKLLAHFGNENDAEALGAVRAMTPLLKRGARLARLGGAAARQPAVVP
jgi:hypothetical protein